MGSEQIRPEGLGRCGDCRYYLRMTNPIVGQPGQGGCHRYPPHAISLPLGGGPGGLQMGKFSTTPAVRDDYGCGEWAPKAIGQKDAAPGTRRAAAPDLSEDDG